MTFNLTGNRMFCNIPQLSSCVMYLNCKHEVINRVYSFSASMKFFILNAEFACSNKASSIMSCFKDVFVSFPVYLLYRKLRLTKRQPFIDEKRQTVTVNKVLNMNYYYIYLYIHCNKSNYYNFLKCLILKSWPTQASAKALEGHLRFALSGHLCL